jgi:SAM-dependent methyltransferase
VPLFVRTWVRQAGPAFDLKVHIEVPGSSAHQCLVCGAGPLTCVPAFEDFYRVTSDCKPWPRGGQLGVCQACGATQNITDARWQAEASQIYADYSIYYQSNGVEQLVFDSSTGQLAERSGRVLRRLDEVENLPQQGRLLDVGCGNGALLRAFAQIRPGWVLAGSDVSDRFRSTVESIPGVERLYTCSPADIPGTFDLIAMMHALEHVPVPLQVLQQLRDKLGPRGLILVQVPNLTQNAFDLLVADHCSHFAPATLRSLIQRAGFEVVLLATDWVSKELSLVARQARSAPRVATPQTAEAMRGVNDARDRLAWLRAVVDQAHDVARQRPFGIFGTSIAAVWLHGELRDVTDFFVDEDPNRTGGTYMGLPIYHPDDVPRGSHVYIGLAPELAERIQARLSMDPRLRFAVYSPPPVAA